MHVIYRWKALDLRIPMTLIYPARYLLITTHSLKFPVAKVSCFTVFAHLFQLNNKAPIPSANFISDGKVQLIHTHDGASPTYGDSVIRDQL